MFQVTNNRIRSQVDRFSLRNTFRILSQTFPNLSSSIFDTIDVYDSGSGLIGYEIIRLDFFVLNFLRVSFSPRFKGIFYSFR